MPIAPPPRQAQPRAKDAKGQRTGIACGNTTSSTLTYDSSTFRLIRQQTVRSGDSAVLQELQLTYDPVGNAVHAHDDGISPAFFVPMRTAWVLR